MINPSWLKRIRNLLIIVTIVISIILFSHLKIKDYLSRFNLEFQFVAREFFPTLYPVADSSHYQKLKIPELDLELEVIRGSPDRYLSSGPVNLPYSQLPGGYGNSVIVGHRNQLAQGTNVFKNLMELEVGDEVYVDDYIFKIIETKYVPATDLSVESQNGYEDRQILTLYTCEGRAQRFVVVAEYLSG